jgi:hypothetical protein
MSCLKVAQIFRLFRCSLRFNVSEEQLMGLSCLSVYHVFHHIVTTLTLDDAATLILDTIVAFYAFFIPLVILLTSSSSSVMWRK